MSVILAFLVSTLLRRFFFFFFYCSGAPRDLHSFPTRRSSDLAIYTHSLLFLVGPAAIALGSAKFLLGWKNKTTQLTSSPWQEYNFVTIDTKRLMVVAHRTNPTVGFEARLPNKELLDQYLRSEERRVGKECRSRWSPSD